VRDDGVGLGAQWLPGTGIANSRERLQHHGGRLELRATAPGTEAVLSLPGVLR
jgi:signal transduction histidine kinase